MGGRIPGWFVLGSFACYGAILGSKQGFGKADCRAIATWETAIYLLVVVPAAKSDADARSSNQEDGLDLGSFSGIARGFF